MKKNCFIVLMRRWGDIEGHTYVSGIYTDKETAIKEGQKEREYRGIKYEYQVMAWQMDSDLGEQVATSMPGPYSHKITQKLMAKQKRFCKKHNIEQADDQVHS